MCLTFFVLYIIFFQFAFYNIITSIFVDKAMKLAKPDDETLLMDRKKEDAAAKFQLQMVFSQLDDDNSGEISLDELSKVCEDEHMVYQLELLQIAVWDVEGFFRSLTAVTEKDTLDMDMFVDGCMKIRGAATSLDVQSIRWQVQGLAEDVRKMSGRGEQNRGSTKS